jgi:hypothetical protein
MLTAYANANKPGSASTGKFFEVGDNFSKKKQNSFNHFSQKEQDIEPLLKQS